MLKRIGALALALAASAVILPAAAQAQECYRPHGVASYGYRRAPVVAFGFGYSAPAYRPPVVAYAAPAYYGSAGWVQPERWRGRDWHDRDHREWRRDGYRR
jgi:hypothetical protein